MSVLSLIGGASSLSGGGLPIGTGGMQSPSLNSFADGQQEVTNQFTSGAFAMGGASASSGTATAALPGGSVMNLVLLAAAAIAVVLVARKLL
ncbi:MAG: hypothetical protein KF769_05455 [Parvibaculum sp.]|nr:hypothetical protein [Parvibaculum sp.]